MSLIDLASLVLAPTAVKDGKVYNAIPNDQDFTFSRGTEATRVNSAGLIEKARTNFLLQSNTFDTTWANVRTSETGGQSGYDGSNDAWKLSQTATSGGHYLNQSISQSGVSTLSIYAKAGEIDYIQIASASTNQQYANFDLTDGSIGNVGTRFFDAQTTSIGNGWYRLSVVNNGVSSLNGFYIVLITSKTSAWLESYSAANATDGLFIQSAQLEQGLVSTHVITTTTSSVTVGITDDLPRVDYSGGGCPSLLLEPSRTQLLTQSEYYSGSTWIKQSGTTVTQNTTDTLSPEGKYNASKVTSNGSNGLFHTVAYSGGGANTKSIYLKGVSGGEVVYLKDPYQTVSTKSCTLTTEWQRFTLSETQTSSASLWIDDIPSGGIYMWGAMLELGSYVSSYIPSYGTSTSRSADSCSLTNASNLIGQSEGTLFWDLETTNTDLYKRLSLNDGSTTNWIFVGIELATGVCRGYVKDSGVVQVSVTGTTDLTGDRIKLALAYANNDFVLYANGSQVATDTSGTVPSCNRIDVGSQNPASDVNAQSTTNQAILFPTRLTNDQLAEITK